MTALVVAEGLLLLAAGPAASRVIPDHVPRCEGERCHPLLIQGMLRRPAEFTGAPPAIGPARPGQPRHAARTSDRPRPPGGAGNVFVVVYDIAAGFGIDPPTGLQRAERDEPAEAGDETARRRVERE